MAAASRYVSPLEPSVLSQIPWLSLRSEWIGGKARGVASKTSRLIRQPGETDVIWRTGHCIIRKLDVGLNELGDHPSKHLAGDYRTESEPDDFDLVKRCQRGEAGGFYALVPKNRPKEVSMIYGMVQNEKDGWDLAQQGVLKAGRSL